MIVPMTFHRFGRRVRRLERPARMRLTAATSRAGERLGLDWVVYNPLVFLYYHEHARASAPVVADTFTEVFSNAKSFVDVGAGTGAFAVELMRRGYDVVAFERSRFARFVGSKQGG
jgi:2-polyprenyl-3-methyl-5-hydroxy-6-metoxy-1,4-benzoquinol methylase